MGITIISEIPNKEIEGDYIYNATDEPIILIFSKYFDECFENKRVKKYSRTFRTKVKEFKNLPFAYFLVPTCQLQITYTERFIVCSRKHYKKELWHLHRNNSKKLTVREVIKFGKTQILRSVLQY